MNKKGFINFLLTPALLVVVAVILVVMFLGIGFLGVYVLPRLLGIFIAVIGLVLIMALKHLNKDVQKLALIASLIMISIGALIIFVPQVVTLLKTQTYSMFALN